MGVSEVYRILSASTSLIGAKLIYANKANTAVVNPRNPAIAIKSLSLLDKISLLHLVSSNGMVVRKADKILANITITLNPIPNRMFSLVGFSLDNMPIETKLNVSIM